ncbi:hypothetical protein DKX38_020910 [Salix brachista]|uniref:Uncharacterized protein n=1 Tax=Salix brachista TaxID=2182728 RepID=A0A5N5KBR8_9ROSI|nr:hypothetical protein DKX38_020910 [Salix brachista]
MDYECLEPIYATSSRFQNGEHEIRVSSSLMLQSASKEQGNCGLGPRRCSSQQRRRVHGMARHSAGLVM